MVAFEATKRGQFATAAAGKACAPPSFLPFVFHLWRVRSPGFGDSATYVLWAGPTVAERCPTRAAVGWTSLLSNHRGPSTPSGQATVPSVTAPGAFVVTALLLSTKSSSLQRSLLTQLESSNICH